MAALAARGATAATAESLTGGALCAAMVAVPGASAVVRGGIVAYTAAMKTRLLNVPAALIEADGVVSAAAAAAMAAGALRATGATFAVATTGVAGPDPHGGQAPGVAWIAIAGPAATVTEKVVCAGDRARVQECVTVRALEMALVAVEGSRSVSAVPTTGE